MDFAETIVIHTRDFTGREWVCTALDRWLEISDGRAFLLTGDPGTGKTALAAWLARMSQGEVPAAGYASLGEGWLAYFHFCQAFNEETLIPPSFVRSLSLALSQRVPGFSEALVEVSDPAITIHAAPQVGEVGPGAQVAGVVIENLYLGAIPGRSAFEQLVRQPLKSVYAAGYTHPVVVMVDSLDEALTYGPDNLATLLATFIDHPQGLPPQVRFIFTSRSDPRVLTRFGPPALDLIADAPPDVDDVRAYAFGRLSQLEEPRRAALAERVAAASEGVFLYARYVLDNLEERPALPEDLTELRLPEGLEGVYRGFLRRELVARRERWEDRYRPLLGLLAVARGPGLRRDQLVDVSGLPASRVDDALRVCAPYLSGALPEGPFTIFHQSFREFLLREREYGVYPAEADQKLGSFFHATCGDDWGSCQDGYAIARTAVHLARAIEAMKRLGQRPKRDRLVAALMDLLLDFHWMQARLEESGIRALIADYERALALDLTQFDVTADTRENLQLVHGALHLSAHVLDRGSSHLSGQLLGRLLAFDQPELQDLLKVARGWRKAAWLRPLTATLNPPGGAELRTLAGHSGSVTGVALTPDGRRAVSASSDGKLKVWDLESGAMRTLRGHSDAVSVVALMPNGRFAISGSRDRTLKLWDLESGAAVRTLAAHAYPVTSLATSPDGKWAVSGSSGGSLKVWDLPSGAEVRSLGGHSGPVTEVALTPDGGRAVSASWDGTLKVWDLGSGRELRVLTGHSRPVIAARVSPDGKLVVSASWDNSLKVWNLASGAELHTLSGHSDSLCSVSLTPDGQRAVSASEDGTLKVWDLRSGAELRTLVGHAEGVSAVEVTLDATRAVSASTDRTLKVWDLRSGAELRTLASHSYPVTAVALTADGRRVVSGSSDTTLKVWDLGRGGAPRGPDGHSDWVNAVTLTPDGQRAVSASRDGTLKVWDLESGAVTQTLAGHSDPVIAVRVSPDGRRAVSCSSDQTLKVWNLESGVAVGNLKGHSHWVNAVALTPDGRRAVSASRDGTLKVWKLATGAELYTLQGHSDEVNAVALTRDGQRAVSASWDGTLKVWDLRSGAELNTLVWHSDGVNAVALTPDGMRAVSASDDNTLILWDLERGEPLRTLLGHSQRVTAVASTSDGERAVSASDDNTLILWDLERGEPLHTMLGHSAPVTAVALTPDGSWMVSASRDKTIKVWAPTVGECLASFHADSVPSACTIRGDKGVIIAGSALGHVHFLRPVGLD